MRTARITKKLAGASNHTTARKADIAYCLLGTFGVNMLMLYREGEQAFVRLQEGIAKHSDGQTLFAWGNGLSQAKAPQGVLANHP
jgi:hypothetical protein